MPTATMPKVNLDKSLDIQRTSSVYPPNTAFSRPAYSISYSPRLVRTGFPDRKANFYDSVRILAKMIENGELPEDGRFSTFAEVHQIYVSKSVGAKKLADVEELRDYFGRNGDVWNAWEETSTGLRVPKGYENGKKDKGTGKYPRLVIETDILRAIGLLRSGASWEDIGDGVNKVVGKLQVPYSQGHVVREVDDVFGIPIEVEGTTSHSTPYAIHFWLKTNPQKDSISGHYDVAVGRGCGWRHVEGERCLDVAADYGRWDAVSYVGFRPVQGSFPEIEEYKLKLMKRI